MLHHISPKPNHTFNHPKLPIKPTNLSPFPPSLLASL